MRLRNDPNAAILLNESNFVIKEFPVNLNSSTILEIGMGKGEMICQLAENNQNKTYIGIEKYPTVAARALKLATSKNLNNFFIICEDILKLQNCFIGNVDEIWLTFSDPWPKKRHYKRRLTYKTFLEIYKTLLSQQGVLKIKTDNDLFFNWSIESINQFGAKIIYKTNDLHQSEKSISNIQTGYEKKWSEKGKKINYMEVVFN